MSYNNRTVAENLRAKNKVLKDKIEAAKDWIKNQPKYGEGGLEELEKILGVVDVSD